jgi:hypothetical protein
VFFFFFFFFFCYSLCVALVDSLSPSSLYIDITPILTHKVVPDTSKVNQLRAKLRKNSKHVDLTKWDDEIILGALQMFFSEMKDCVLTCGLYSCWTAAMGRWEERKSV